MPSYSSLQEVLGYSTSVSDKAGLVIIIDDEGKFVAFVQEDGKAIISAKAHSISLALGELEEKAEKLIMA